MKRVLKYILLLVMVAPIVVGCLSDSSLGVDGNKSMEIRLWADMGYTPGLGTMTGSRGGADATSGIIDAVTDTVLTMGMARIDEAYSPLYPAFLECDEPIIAELGRPNPQNNYFRDIEFKSAAQFFYNTTDYVKYVAWQPWQPNKEGYEYSTTSTATTVKIPITGDSDILYGNVTTGSQTEGFELMTFDHALCIYRIYVYAMQEESGVQSSAWGVLEDMEIEDLPTSCTLTLPKDDGVFGIAYEGKATLNLADENNNIYFSPGEKIPVGLANRRMVAKCVAAPPTDEILHISLATSGLDVRQRVAIARDFKAGHAYDVVLRFSNHGLVNGDVSVGEWKHHDEAIEQDVEVDMFYDLSNYETANSYIVNSANYGYCFDATVKGNGESRIVGGTSALSNVKYVDILWDDTPMITIDGEQRKALTLDTHELSHGRVLLHVQGNPNDREDKRLLSEGNVVIAAYDEKGGNILWTWHIWLTDRVSMHGYPSGYIVHDRNLGATSAMPDGGGGTDGLYYQWGRPTPFKPASSGVYGALSKVPNNPAQVATVEEAVANPTTLYGSGDSARHDWLATKRNNLWGYQNEHTDLEKTMYDPCPPGYMVADMRVWQNIAQYETDGGWRGGQGVHLSVASNDVWYPFQGYIESDGTENLTRNMVRLWSSVIDLTTTNTSPYELQYTASKNAGWNSSESHRNRALPVRCVSSHSTTIVTNLSASQTANSYMVHRSGYYKFKATVRGNGVGSLLPLGGTTTAEINGGLSTTIAPAKVDLLWWQGDFTEVTGGESDIENLMPLQLLNNGVPDKDGYVTFYVGNYHKGNVGLAAYDVDGEVLWSWHIWLTDKPADLITGNYTLMDRFLGATTAPNTSGTSISFASEKERMATYGFYYQWGRKDPIMGAPSYSAGTETVNGKPKSSKYWVKDYLTGKWSSRTDIDTAAAATIPVVTQNPMTFYMSTSLCGNTTCGWFPATFADGYTNVALWGYAVKDYSIQGQTFSKTMHDPCPPGYRTPFHHAWGYLVGGTHYGYTYGEGGGNINFSNNEASFDNYGVVFNKTYFDRAWYPFVGYRYPTTGGYRDVGANGYMLTGMPMGQYNCRTYVYTKSYSGQVDVSGTNGGYGPAYALPARCQKE